MIDLVMSNVETYIPPLPGAAKANSPKKKAKASTGNPVKFSFGSDSDDGEDESSLTPSDRFRVEDEVRIYKTLPTLDSEGNPLSWWKERASTFPILSKVAARLLFIPATSVPCERLFSLAGHICNKKRSALSSEKLEELVLLNNWLK